MFNFVGRILGDCHPRERARTELKFPLCRLFSPQKKSETTMEEKKPRRSGVGGTGISIRARLSSLAV